MINPGNSTAVLQILTGMHAAVVGEFSQPTTLRSNNIGRACKEKRRFAPKTPPPKNGYPRKATFGWLFTGADVFTVVQVRHERFTPLSLVSKQPPWNARDQCLTLIDGISTDIHLTPLFTHSLRRLRIRLQTRERNILPTLDPLAIPLAADQTINASS
jgi:hypothetical protein